MDQLMNLTSSWNFTLENYDSVWSLVVQILVLLIALILGNILRRAIYFLKKSLIPSALIGGVILLGVNALVKVLTKNSFVIIDQRFAQVITYHALAIGFIAMTLKVNTKKENVPFIKACENGAMTGATYMLQAIVGIIISIIFYLITNDIFFDAGVILPLGFGQGPGNALTWDVTFSELIIEGNKVFDGNGSFGLTIASIGFIVASIIGVIYINIFKKRGEIKVVEEKDIKKDVSHYEQENEVPDSESIDKFSIQVGLVAIAYALSFGIMVLLGSISNFTNSIAWGFNFIWGVISANLVKLFIKLLKKKEIMHRTYINNYQMDRISGFAFDIMIVAGVAAIEIEDVKKYLWLVIVLCVVGTIATIIYVRVICKKRFKGYEHEMFVTNFGTLTGTASNGMILLKEIDPNFDTPASNLFVVSQLPAMIFVAPLLLLLNFSSLSLRNTSIALGIFIVLFIAYNIFIFRDKIFKKKELKNEQK